MSLEISRVRHPKEKLYGRLMLVIGTVIWAIGALTVVYAVVTQGIGAAIILALYVTILWFASYVARSLIRAYMIGHYVLVGPDQFSHLFDIVAQGAAKLGLKDAPQAFVYNSSGVMNAMALRLVGRTRYIWLTSALIDADSDEQVRFVIGHELGHHAAGHLDEPWSLLRLPAHLIPFLAPAYSRARELTCDRVGALIARDIRASRSALQMLACGSAKLNSKMNTEAFQKQEQMVPSVAGFMLHIFSGYPRLTRRVEALTQWYETVRRKTPVNSVEPTQRMEPQGA